MPPSSKPVSLLNTFTVTPEFITVLELSFAATGTALLNFTFIVTVAVEQSPSPSHTW